MKVIKYILILIFTLLFLLPLLFWFLNIGLGTKFSTSSIEWSNFGGFLGGLYGPILSTATLLFIWFQSRKDNYLLVKNIFVNEILTILENMDAIEEYYKKYYLKAIEMCDLDGQLHLKDSTDEERKRTKDKMNSITKNYQNEENDSYLIVIEKSLVLSKIIFGQKSLHYIIPFFEMAKSVNLRLSGNMIGNGSNLYFNDYEYSFLKRKIYKFIYSNHYGEKGLLYDNWLDFAKTDMERIKDEINSERL